MFKYEHVRIKREAPNSLKGAAAAGEAQVQALRKDVVAVRTGTDAPPALSIRKLAVRFGARTILNAINLNIGEGEFLCVVGSSGSGKTTLLRALAGLATPAEGTVLFEGAEISGPSRDRAIIFQDYSKALLPWRTVHGNVALSLEARNVAAGERHAVIAGLLAKMGLSQAQEQFPGQLSGGMQQRVQIARCLAQEPKLLLMDEPFGALDAMTRQTLQDEILQLTAERRVTTVFITHDLEEAIYLGDRVVVLGQSPATIVTSIEVELPRPRNQLTTREDGRFLAYRHRLFEILAHERFLQPRPSKGGS
jgi:ABC-type nitrate/sulfonate/bicarbonate transport system ATPase subunit